MTNLKDGSLFRQAALVGGRWVEANGAGIAVTNPATGEVIGHVPKLGARETAEAIEVARKAQGAWAARTAKERSVILRRWFDLMMQNQDDLGRILTLEQGKPLAEAKGEIAYGASFIEWFAEEARRVYGDVIPGHAPDKRIVVIKQAIGVVAAITDSSMVPFFDRVAPIQRTSTSKGRKMRPPRTIAPKAALSAIVSTMARGTSVR